METPNYNNLEFDLDTIMEFITHNDSDNVKNSEITEMYGVNDEGSLTLLNKQINENKSTKSDSNTTIRYDLIKMMFNWLYEMTDNGEILTPSQQMVYNTFTTKGFIKKIV